MNTGNSNPAERICVAMSGGVDSSAAALLLHDSGLQVIGVSMQVWDYRKNNSCSDKATCCAPADFDDARLVAEKAGFPYYVFDFETSFRRDVIEPFVQAYLSGSTPNPCIVCNSKVKFKELRTRARSLGCTKVATGHYAQIKEVSPGEFGLFSGADTAKDQSYFLYDMTQRDLGSTVFPLGAMTKDEVRALLKEQGLSVADKAESQDICFVSGTVPEFIEAHSEKVPAHGSIVSSKGEVLGTHAGIHHYTVGQRRGLGVSAENPLYVLNIDSSSNEVVVGEKHELEKEGFYVRQINWISGLPPKEPFPARVKMRYRHAGVSCRVEPIGKDEAAVSFADKWSAVSPGQAAVFYAPQAESDGSVLVIGGGTIDKEGSSQ